MRTLVAFNVFIDFVCLVIGWMLLSPIVYCYLAYVITYFVSPKKMVDCRILVKRMMMIQIQVIMMKQKKVTMRMCFLILIFQQIKKVTILWVLD